jgi:uncharacterized protein
VHPTGTRQKGTFREKVPFYPFIPRVFEKGPMRKILSTLLVKPAGPDCNLSCRYCFYLGKSSLFPGTAVHRMDESVLAGMVRRAMEEGGDAVNYAWQGGEPTLMGVDFFRKAVALQARFGRPGQTVGNGLQTNGVLINGEWADFLLDACFLVGLSLDGPQPVHDRYRCAASGRGSWRDAVRARDMLLGRGVAVNAMSVVTSASQGSAREMYEFHKSGGLVHMQFIPCVEPDPLRPGALSAESVTAEGYGRFLRETFDLWTADFRNGGPTAFVRFFDDVFYAYAGLAPPECTLLPECGVYLAVEHNGEVFPCDFFVEPGLRLGNVMRDGLGDMLNSKAMTRFGEVKSALPPECADCEWFANCRAGCPKDRRALGDPSGSNPLCGAFKAFFGHADPFFRRLAEDWKAAHGRVSGQGPGQGPGRAGAHASGPSLRDGTGPMGREGSVTGQASLGGPGPGPSNRAGRNDPCPCGSGRKYKHCCGAG